MDLSVIIVSYNTCSITKGCLDSIFEKTTGINFEVIVVDNDSHDGSKEMLESYPDIVYIQSGDNLGFGRANNLGYKKAKGKYILLLNSDTYLLNNALKCFVTEFDQMDESVGCIGAKLLKPDQTPNHSFQKLPSLAGDFRNMCEVYLRRLNIRLYHMNERDFDNQERFRVEYITGADLCIRKSVIDRYGLFDPDYFMYFEETDMQVRYQKAGLCGYIVSTPKIVHLEGVSSKRKSFSNRKMYMTSHIMFRKKNYSFISYFLSRVFLMLSFPIAFAKYYSLRESLAMLVLFASPYHIINKRCKQHETRTI